MNKLCPECGAKLRPVYHNVIRSGGKLMQLNEKNELVEAVVAEWLCDDCGQLYSIVNGSLEVTGIIC